MVNGSKENPHREGQFITYTCPPAAGFVLIGPNASVCTGIGEWEPDPGQVDCIGDNNNYYVMHMILLFYHAADCGEPLVDGNVTLNYNSTLEGSRSVLVLTCENMNDNEQIIIVTCQSSGNWIPDPTQFTCSSSITVHVPPAAGTGLEIILGSVLGVLIIGATVIITAVAAILCLIKGGTAIIIIVSIYPETKPIL